MSKAKKEVKETKVFLGERVGGSRVYDKDHNLISINGVPVKPVESRGTDG